MLYTYISHILDDDVHSDLHVFSTVCLILPQDGLLKPKRVGQRIPWDNKIYVC